MSKHLNWPEDDRICHLPDPIEGNCPNCCGAINPKTYAGANWECIFKVGHISDHTDIWLFEWNDEGKITKRPNYNGRCYNCGDYVPVDGMMYCGKACERLSSND